MRIYLDNAATTPLSKEVLEAMMPWMTEHYGNPSSIHSEGRRARTAIEQARRTIAKCLNASLGEIFFTSCGTESNNWALKSAVRDLGVQRIITTKAEHHCVLHATDALKQYQNIEIIYLTLSKEGHISLEELQNYLSGSDKKTLVSLIHANNEIGTILDIKKVGDLCLAHQAFFHTDTVQTLGYYPIDVQALNISFLSGSGHKFHGPKGIGFLYINGDNIIKPYIDGGAQERNMRAGTENLHGIVGLAKALEIVSTNRAAYQTHIEGLKSHMIEALKASFEDIRFNGDLEQGHYKILSVSFPPTPKTEMLVMGLDIAGISASGGSACSSGAEHDSHVIEAIGGDIDRKTIRFSFSSYNTKEQIDIVINKIKNILPSIVKEFV